MVVRQRRQILDIVEENRQDTLTLRNRMDEDYNLWNLTPYDHEDLEGFKKYTSNEPRTQFNKIMSLLTTAKMLIQINQARHRRESRDIRNMAERFYIGAFRANDERLVRTVRPRLQSLLAHYICLRGFFAGRALLVKGEGRRKPPYIDITPFDPRYTYWQMGSEGPMVLVHKTWKTAAQIKQQYGVSVRGEREPSALVEVFDWYDEEHNGVLTKDQILKKATKHGSPCMPCFFGAVGPSPLVYAEGGVVTDTIKDWGESIFQANRATWGERNYQMSIMSEFVGRSLKRPYAIKSPDGTLMLPENPFFSGSEIPLKDGEDIVLLDVMDMARETGALHGITAGEGQRGGIPWSSFGEINQPISGFAINSLRQGQSTPLEPPLEALISAYKQITRLLKEQYSTGKYADITVEGKDNSRDFFSEEVPPQVVKDGGDPEIIFVPELPQDDIQAAAMAFQLRQPDASGQPMFSDRWLRENVMKVQDADSVGDELLEQQAVRTSKLASIRKMMMASLELGDEETAQIWFGEAKQEMLKELLELMQLKAAASQLSQPQQPQNGGTPAGPPRFDPRVAPNAQVGAPPPAPTPPQPVPPGRERPGANGDMLGLAELGLFGPGG